jgi:hypothetical protein
MAPRMASPVSGGGGIRTHGRGCPYVEPITAQEAAGGEDLLYVLEGGGRPTADEDQAEASPAPSSGPHAGEGR